MMIKITGYLLGALVSLPLIIGLSHIASAGEEETITAFSVVAWQGQTFAIGFDQAMLVGALGGTVYVETEHGPVASGRILCPFVVEVNATNGAQKGFGRCTVTADDGALIFAEISCTGIRLVGCSGDFKLLGGTGRFEGIAGGGPVTTRADFRKIVDATEESLTEVGTGIMFWPTLRYSLP